MSNNATARRPIGESGLNEVRDTPTFPAPDETPVQLEIAPEVAENFPGVAVGEWQWDGSEGRWGRRISANVKFYDFNATFWLEADQWSAKPGIVETDRPVFDYDAPDPIVDMELLRKISGHVEACLILGDAWNRVLDVRSIAAARTVDFYRWGSGVRQAELAVSVDLGPDELSNRMTGKVRFEEDVLHDLARALGVSWGSFEAKIQEELGAVDEMDFEPIPIGNADA